MNTPVVAFAIPPDVRPRSVQERATEGRESHPLGETAIDRVYLDTFDWRLFRAGYVLIEERERGRRVLRLASRGDEPTRAVSGRRPAFGRDLPDGWMRERLAPILGPRRLLPRVRVRGEASGVALLDDQEKTVVRLFVERTAAELPDGADATLPTLARVERLRGYDADANRLAGRLADVPGAKAIDGSTLEHALRSLGEWPGTDPSRPQVTLHASTRADHALRAILSAELSVVEANEHGVAKDLDVEFLHDLRVACRRSRALLSELGDELDADAVAAARDGLAWIGEQTGPLRDLDVFLARMDGWAAGADAETLEPLRRAAVRARKRALRDVRKMLASKRYRAVLDAWRGYLDGDPDDTGTNGSVGRTISAAARERVRRRAERVVERGRKIKKRTPIAKVHRLRLQAKKLRYLLDAFAPLLAKGGAPSLRARLRKLQNALGDVNDAQVEISHLTSLGEKLAHGSADADAAAHALLAMGRRQAELERKLRRARERIPGRVDRLAGDDELRALCEDPA